MEEFKRNSEEFIKFKEVKEIIKRDMGMDVYDLYYLCKDENDFLYYLGLKKNGAVTSCWVIDSITKRLADYYGKNLKEKLMANYRIIENVEGEEVLRKTLTKDNALKYLMRNCKEPWSGWSTKSIEGFYEGINGNGFTVEQI